jgi:hypothetical protein
MVDVPETMLRDLLGAASAAAALLAVADPDELSAESTQPGREWLARAVQDRAEALAALMEGRPAGWDILMEVSATMTALRQRGLLLPPPAAE